MGFPRDRVVISCNFRLSLKDITMRPVPKMQRRVLFRKTKRQSERYTALWLAGMVLLDWTGLENWTGRKTLPMWMALGRHNIVYLS